ncbi:MAG: RluA family pseudouridine synthase [Termitinemataceae bacterium]|nr:MAG: RluA family pseudouridine synthase [Termitinemataceae bacterium]
MKKIQPFSIVYQDDDIIAVNKSSGISVNPDRYDREKKNLFELLCTVTGKRLWLVHRIDNETSGLVIFAKKAKTHQKLSMAFENRTIKKTYTAILSGRPSWQTETCDLPLVPNGNKLHRTIVDRYQGKKSITHFNVVLSVGNYTVVEVKPETGRTHQIRVHAAALGHPVVCDRLYAKIAKPVYLSDFKKKWRGDKITELPLLDRLALHAAKLELPDYARKKLLEAPLSRDMNALITQFEKIAKPQGNNLSPIIW